jgi:hypothetical protein
MISFFKIEKREEKRKFKHIFICHPELDSGSSEEYFTLYFISWPSRHFSCGKNPQSANCDKLNPEFDL